MEATETVFEEKALCDSDSLEKILTPGITTIEDLEQKVGVEKEQICKAVVYQRNVDDKYVVVFIRGDLDVNETKLRNVLQAEVHAAKIEENSELIAGFIGPIGITSKAIVLFDSSLKRLNNLVCGANEGNAHYKGLDLLRDMPNAQYVDLSKIYDGAICPICGEKKIRIHRGVEVGNIFQLGTKYTESMNMKYIDADGNSRTPIMGCYGIGVGRLAASVCEAHHDENGPIWPINIASWEVHICCLRADDDENKAVADKLYTELGDRRIETVYDDRRVSTGVMFSVADLLGVPIRVIVSPRNLKQHCVEITTSDKSVTKIVDLDVAVNSIVDLVNEIYKKETQLNEN